MGSRLAKQRRSQDNDYFSDVFVEGVTIKKKSNDSGNLSIRDSFELKVNEKQQITIDP